MVHKPKHKVHSFRGLLGDGGQDEINLERQNANVAYRIVKLELMGETPGATTQESVVKIYRESQSSIDATVHFTDNALLAAGIWHNNANVAYPVSESVIFDNILFSRNIHVTHSDADTQGASCNYYIELEEVPVSASALMQLKLGVARRLNLTESPADA